MDPQYPRVGVGIGGRLRGDEVTVSTRAGARVRFSGASHGAIQQEIFANGRWEPAGRATYLRWNPATGLLTDQARHGYELDGDPRTVAAVVLQVKALAERQDVRHDIEIDPYGAMGPYNASLAAPYNTSRGPPTRLGVGRDREPRPLPSYIPDAHPRSAGMRHRGDRGGYISMYGGVNPHTADAVTEGSSIDGVDLDDRLQALGYGGGEPGDYDAEHTDTGTSVDGWQPEDAYDEGLGVSEVRRRPAAGEITGFHSRARHARRDSGASLGDPYGTPYPERRTGKTKSRFGVQKLPRDVAARVQAAKRAATGGYSLPHQGAPAYPPVASYAAVPSVDAGLGDEYIEMEVRRRCAAYVEGLKAGMSHDVAPPPAPRVRPHSVSPPPLERAYRASYRARHPPVGRERSLFQDPLPSRSPSPPAERWFGNRRFGDGGGRWFR